MSIDTWANIGVSIGTILLAILGYVNIIYGNKQLNFFKSQLKLMKDQNNPFLQAYDVSFEGNKISFKIENIGVGNAHEIGVYSHFQPVNLTNLATESNSLLELAKIGFQFEDVIKLEPELQITKWNELFNEGKLKEYYPKLWFEVNTKKLYDLNAFDKCEIKSSGFVTFADTKYTNLVIPPNSNLEFTCEPLFNIEYTCHKKVGNLLNASKSASKGIPAYRHFNIDELIKIMKHNNTGFFNLIFYLKYKNKFEDQLESVFLSSFVFSIKEHSNLQDAFEQDFIMIRPIGHREIEKRLGGVPSFLYDNATSELNSNEL